MSDPEPSPGTATLDDSFASGMVAHFDGYRTGKDGAGPIFVTIRLADGGINFLEGLRIEHLSNVPGCVMVRGTSPASHGAIVVREEYLIMALYDTEPDSSLGFSSRL